MEIWASVNETDMGAIRIGQPVHFTVGAFPGESFPGKVSQVRLNASMNQGVVTYTVVVSFDNPEGRLLPYLTARLQCWRHCGRLWSERYFIRRAFSGGFCAERYQLYLSAVGIG